jgi:hypothetical protein
MPACSIPCSLMTAITAAARQALAMFLAGETSRQEQRIYDTIRIGRRSAGLSIDDVAAVVGDALKSHPATSFQMAVEKPARDGHFSS